jgi:hypothetical protein
VLWINPVDLTDLRLVKTGEGSNAPVLQPDLTQAGADQINGARILSTPALPSGTAVLGDARQLVLGVRQDVSVQFSPHAKFTADAVVARVTARADWAVSDARGLIRVAARAMAVGEVVAQLWTGAMVLVRLGPDATVDVDGEQLLFADLTPEQPTAYLDAYAVA